MVVNLRGAGLEKPNRRSMKFSQRKHQSKQKANPNTQNYQNTIPQNLLLIPDVPKTLDKRLAGLQLFFFGHLEFWKEAGIFHKILRLDHLHSQRRNSSSTWAGELAA
jgi:hypothetical protein